MHQRPIIAIENVAVVDVVRGEIVKPRTVLIDNGRIAAIGEPDAIDIPSATVRVDGGGRYLMPGLVDMHVHLFNNASHRAPNDWAFPLFVANGVTGVREMSTEPAAMAVVNGWREKVAEASWSLHACWLPARPWAQSQWRRRDARYVKPRPRARIS